MKFISKILTLPVMMCFGINGCDNAVLKELKPKFRDKVKILAIGNSFSEDAATYIQDFAKADGIDLTLRRLYIGGCSFLTHWNNAASDAQAYDYNETGKQSKKSSIKETLESQAWDFITMQQVSHESGISETYYPYLTDLSEYIKKYKPHAIQLIHQTWSYETGSAHSGFVKYNNNQETMFLALKDAYKKAADTLKVKILPSGEAWQKARRIPLSLIHCTEMVFTVTQKGNI